MGLVALLFLYTCCGVTGGGQGVVGEVADFGLPWLGASLATAPCSS